MNNITILATFWNEKYWIESSLQQLDQLNVKRIIICEGCFDYRFPLHSTDGTYEIIKEFVKNHSNATLITPYRFKSCKEISFINAVWNDAIRKRVTFSIPYVFRAFIKANYYRSNQALTFGHMLNLADVNDGDWFMTYDADQFYEDSFYHFINNLNYLDPDIDYLFANERTFISNYNIFTNDKGPKYGTNLPFRYKKNTIIMPTRNMFLLGGLKIESYYNTLKGQNIGKYNHYKINYDNRVSQTYMVGDRIPPSYNGMRIEKFTGKHPAIITKKLLSEGVLECPKFR